MQHPAQAHNVDVIAALIEQLRSCRTFIDYDEMQRHLFQILLNREEHKASARRCAARLRRGKSLPSSLPQLPPGADPNDADTWRIEDLVFDRVCRQLRAVGDGLARRASGYDRRYIIAMSSNASAGVMAGKQGLPAELGAATSLRDRANRGGFGLLHDLTNCLRIGDITEFVPGEMKLLYEIKTSSKAKKGPQRRRINAAVEAVMSGGELPGRPGNRIVTPSIRCRTHIRTFVDLINEAWTRGIAGTPVADSRALTAYSFPTLARTQAGGNPRDLDREFEGQRLAAIADAGIASVLHHVRVASVMRNHDVVPSVMPFALFPLAPQLVAFLICDYIGFDITVAPDRIASRLAAHGIATDIPLPLANGSLTASDTVITLTKGSRRLSLHPGALYELLIESLELDTWTAALAEVIDDPNAPPHPVLAFETTPVWR